MKTEKGTMPLAAVGGSDVDAVLSAFLQLSHLKRVYRKGWLRFVSPEECESDADHSFGTAVLAILLAEKFFPHLNREKIVLLALLHEAGEVYAGDTTPHDGIDRTEQKKRERESVLRVFSRLPKGGKIRRALGRIRERRDGGSALREANGKPRNGAPGGGL